MTPEQIKQYQEAIAASLASDPEIARIAGNNDPATIVSAYMNNDWSKVVGLSGKPFTDAQQAAAVAEAERVLAPAYEAEKTYQTAGVDDTLRKATQGFGDFQAAEEKGFIENKNTLDKNAADSGVLFSGSRAQKLRDLRSTYMTREDQQRRNTTDAIGSAGRAYQYTYGNEAAGSLTDKYRLPGSTTFNPNVPGGGVSPTKSLSSVYDSGKYDFQGTAPVAQKAAVNVRAAGQLANRANKLSLAGYGSKL